MKTNRSKTGIQRALYCRCGREKVLALGLCASCYTMKRQDDEYFGGLREQVLERDGHCCRVCGASGRRKRSIVVHHRVPGKSLLHLMISLCPGCHAKVGRTKAVLSRMPPLLLQLWREQHPDGHEQTTLDFRERLVLSQREPSFVEPSLIDRRLTLSFRFQGGVEACSQCWKVRCGSVPFQLLNRTKQRNISSQRRQVAKQKYQLPIL